jgi:hypothetical protein
MRAILSAAGRAFLRDAAVAFFALATGIFAAPDYRQAAALAGAASIAALIAGVRAVRVFVPQISEGLAKALHVPVAYAEVVLTGLTTLLVGFVALVEGVLSAPDLEAGKAAAVAGILAIGTALVRVVQTWFTPGETPAPKLGIPVPNQPVPAAALPPPAVNPDAGQVT